MVRIAIAKAERLLGCSHEREIADAVVEHQRAAAEGAQDVDDYNDAARVGGAGEQAATLNLHRAIVTVQPDASRDASIQRVSRCASPPPASSRRGLGYRAPPDDHPVE